MRRLKRDRGKPIPKSDLDAIAKFRAELTVYGKLRKEGATHTSAMRAVFADDWSGLCAAGLHGLDYKGQACDLCAVADAPSSVGDDETPNR